MSFSRNIVFLSLHDLNEGVVSTHAGIYFVNLEEQTQQLITTSIRAKGTISLQNDKILLALGS
jgi:hypothetical protein